MRKKLLVKMRIFWKHLLLCIFITLLSGNAADKSPPYDGILMQNEDFSEDNEPIDYRLPTAVKPISYDIMLIPQFNDYTFKGIAKIETEIKSATNKITVHVGNIEIELVSVASYDANKLNSTYDNITEKYTVTLPDTLKEGKKVLISFTYNGILADNMIGFYRSSYINEKGQTKWLAATQFQTTHARHAFPCFDEPSFKANFTIRIARDKNYKCLSNMPLASSGQLAPGGKTWDVFEETVPMSTYLVAFVISELDSLPGENNFTVWSRPSTINQANYALEIGTAALDLFNETFQQEYELPKMDMVAIPDFAAGAMENWGLVTYREARMLYDEKESSALAQQSVASVVIHELAHMWFGNLVTPEWWSCLWLSEGFATYFQYFGTAEIENTWNMEEQFVVAQHQSALIADGLESSLSMTRKVSTKSHIAGIGDTITYAKGASIVRMMNLIFGTKVFNFALQNYIQNNKKEGLGSPDALWEAIKDQVDSAYPALNIPVKTIMDTWTTKPGYPVISITINDNGIVNIAQERFLLRNLDGTPKNVTWYVPITVATQSKDFNNTNPKYWISAEKSTANLKINPKDWVVFNVQSSGFYRVNYNAQAWQNIFNALNNKVDDIHVLNRAGIVDDLLNLGRAGYQNYNLVLEGLLYLKNETNYLPFKAALNGLEYLNKRFTGAAEHFLFKTYVLSLIDNIRLTLGYEDRESDDRLMTLLRQEVNYWACNFNDHDCVITYTKKFGQWKANATARIKPNERTTAYCVAIRHGTSEDWEFLWKEYSKSNHAADQMVILSALGCSQNTTILEKYLKFAISDYETSRIRKQDSTSVFTAVYNSGLLGAEYVLDFVEKHHKEMEKYYGGQGTIATILDGVSQCLSTSESVDKFEKLINNLKTDFASIQTSLNASLRIAQYELEWYNSNSPSIIQRLRTYHRAAYRLPTDIIPTKYFISITPHLKVGNFTVDGKVKIEADVHKPTAQITLHSSEIKHHDVIVMANEKKVIVLRNRNIASHDFHVLYLNEKLTAGTRLTIEITYTSHLNASELRGFYKSSYENEKGETRWLAASHLEPVGARKMFPCFDEPAMKAQFTVEVNVPLGYNAISNMRWDLIKNADDHLSYTFKETMPMSTYLVAVIVSDFKCKSIQKDTTKLAVYARPNAIDQADYALSVMSPLVNFFETTYKQKYQIQKLYMAALPDFPSGAMENWGLLTYKEANMLYDENHSPITNKQDIRNVIAHEISHQWFGNLVSPQWWKYLWLNEGFARYFQYHAPARVPTFNDTTQLEWHFVVDQVHSAFSADSSNSTHPMSHEVSTPREIQSIFDTITYAKGGSILRMVEKTYGTKVFNEALTDYLNKRKYSVATPEDLYEALQAKVNEKGLKIKTILDTWTTQAGYPVVNIDVTKDFITIEQERFFFKKHENDPTDSTIWYIPITWTSVKDSSNNSNTTPQLWLTTKKIYIQKPSDSLLIFNTQQSGYYRVNYNKEHWMELIKYLKNEDIETIHEINRAALIDDLMNLARAEYINYKTAISAITYLTKENSYFPWRAFFNNLPYLNNRFAGRDIEELYKIRLTSLIEELYTRLGFEDRVNDDDLTKMLRIHARKWACKLDVTDCKFRAAKYFQQKQHSETIPPNYRDVVYCTAMRIDKTNYNYNFLWKEYLNSNVTTDKLVILNSLACSESEEVLETLLLEAIKEDSDIRYQDSAKVFSNVYDKGLIGVEVVMKVIEKYYEDILNRHFNDYTKVESIMSALASRLSTFDLYDQYQKLSEVLVTKEPLFKESLDTYLVAAKYEFDWYDRNVPLIFEALDNWEETTVNSSNTYRLPKTLYPKLYNVSLTPYMKDGTFEGNVKIHMTVKTDTSLIVLNSHNLEIKKIKVSRNDIEIPSFDPKENVTTQQLWIYLSEYVHANEEITAEIDFNGILNDNMKGFYRSSYFDNNGNQHWLATTQFEPTHAREAFPCFDEPAFKAKFTINIQRLTDYKALSNMPLDPNPPNIKPKNDSYKWDTFKTSNVTMSTYLVAFVVSKFEPAVDPEKVTLNVWGRPEVVTHGTYAQEIGEKLIEKLQNITDIDYYDALPKLDLVGIPDFDMGAMENWGLATFREYGLFYDKDETTSTYEKYIITVIAHELTHMWFGNLVTCEWWDYIWLNEGFAQYFESLASDEIWPEYKFMDQFVVYELQSALSQDASISTHPMTNPVRTPEEIAGVFDYVAYGKSASVLRMIFNKFDEYGSKSILALRDYLNKHRYSTANPTDLWKSFEPHVSISLDNVTNVSIEEVMNTWTDQPGYPVVNATLTGYLLRLTQERFLINRDTVSNEFYWIPIDVYVQSDNLLSDRTTVERKVWLGQEPRSIYINPNNDWFIVNYKQTGFYRVNYDTDSWKRLISKLNTKEFEAIDVLNRAQIIDDLFNLARATYVDYELLMSAVTYLRQETNHLPWKAFFNGLSYIYERFEQQNYQTVLDYYVLNMLLSNVYKNVGFDDRENNEHLDKLNQELILQWACKLNETECTKKSDELFTAWHTNSSQRIPRNARPAVYCTAIKRGTTDDWEFLWNKYLEANLASEKKIIINALGCSTNKTILQTYLERAIKMYDPVNAAIRRQDVSAVFASVYSAGPLGVTATLEFLIDKRNPVHDYFSKKEIADLFVNVASHISNEGQHDTLVNYIENWINDYPPGKIRAKLRSAITTAETNLLWYKNNAYKITKWILLNLPPTDNGNQTDSSTRIESLNVVFMTLIALMSYLLSYY
jgi:aminopeptidase N